MKRMKAFDFLERPLLSSQAAVASNEVTYPLNIAGVYQDSVTRDWAIQSYFEATPLAGKDRIQSKWYDVNSLSDSGILLDAVHTALAADVIVVSVYAADDLPLDLYAWIAAWLPRRFSRVGALAALVGVVEPLDSQFIRTIEYLQAVARRAQLDFIPHARRRTFASPIASQPKEDSAAANATSLQDRNGQRYFSYYHCGLNE
jgi:hypothetical protein